MRSIFFIGLFVLQACAPAAVLSEVGVGCTSQQIEEALQGAGEYTPSQTQAFVQLRHDAFVIDNQPFTVHGINYYPARYPWRRFLTETDTETLRKDFALMREAGINTLRLFLWQYALFICPNDEAVPHPAHFERLDTIVHSAAEHGFRLILTLNDLPDLDQQPLYSNPLKIQNQIRFIVERYRDERAILAWDLRNEGDIDYGSHPSIQGKFTREEVLNWLGRTSMLVREIDTNHFITAGWLYHAEDTAPYVDFISFHHWTDTDELLGRLAEIRRGTDKPVLLQEFGYSVPPDEQAQNIRQIIEMTRHENLLGWMIWTAFDFPLDRSCYPSPCQSEDNREHHFGIWYADYREKPAVDVIRSLTN
jgi:endo-1,4-beta-mannosidase